MKYPPEMAERLLRKWQDLSTVLVVSLNTLQLAVSTSGTITAFEPNDGIEISLLAFKSFSGEVTAAPGSVSVLLKDATFEYVESSEAPPEVREQSVAMIVCVLSIRLPDLVFTLSEMRNQPEIEGETAIN